MTSKPFAPVFIVGSERSGTTLMAALLDRHSQLSIPPETLFFSDLVHQGPWLRRAGKRSSLLKKALDGRIGEFGLDPAALASAFESREASLPGLLQASLETYALARGKARCGEKSILHIFYVPEILAWYPQAKIIGMVRDGRDVVSSMLRPPWHPNKLRAKCCNWRLKMRLLMQWERRYPAQFKALRYEALLENPEKILREADAFLGLDFEARQLDASVKTEVFLKRERSYKSKVQEAIDPSRAFAWKQGLPPSSLAAMGSIMNPTLQALGYAAVEERPGLLDLALAKLWIPAFDAFVRLRGLILYDKIRYRWRKRTGLLLRLAGDEGVKP